MNKVKIFICALIYTILMGRVFACDIDVKKEYKCEFARVTFDATLPELVNGVEVYGERIKGIVFFEGFDFLGYVPESIGIEPMLEETYIHLKEFYSAENQADGQPVPFVFIGHSQGGLRALAMSTYLRNADPELYKQLKGVITVSGIDKGLKLLENRGANFRSRLYVDVNTFLRGIYGTVQVFNVLPDNIVFAMFAGQSLTDATYIIGDYILCKCWDMTKGFAFPIMNNAKWDEYAQIRDMCPQSEFIKKYVLEEKPYYYKVADGTKTSIVWKKGRFGISYPTIGKETVYKTVQTNDVSLKVDRDLPLKFVVGTLNDSLSMAESGIRIGFGVAMNGAGIIFTSAAAAHVAKTAMLIGLLTNSPLYAVDCGNAAAMCFNYKGEINKLLGETGNDGLVAESSQQLPEYSMTGSSAQVKVLNKSTRVFYCRNHANIVDVGSASRTQINNYAAELLGMKNR